MRLTWLDWPQWSALAEQRLAVDWPLFKARDPRGLVVRIEPSAGWHHELTWVAGDGYAVRPDGSATLEQLVHSPHLVRDKARTVRREADGSDHLQVARERWLDGASLLLGASPNYYHWFVDNVPRLLLARHVADLRGLRLMVHAPLLGYHRQTLALLGVDSDLLEPVAADESLTGERVLVPGLLASSALCHPMVPDLLRRALPSRAPGRHERIYLSRQDAPTRRLTNEDELTALLARYGYVRVVPGELDVQAQIDLAAGARHLVAVHGAAVTNLLFCDPGASVVEIHSTEHRPTFFKTLAMKCGHRHETVPARNITHGADGNPMAGTWEVDLGAMQACLQRLHGG